MDEQEVTPEMIEELEDQRDDQVDDQAQAQQEFNEAYGAPEPEQQMNAQAYLWNASFQSRDTLRTTFLEEGELGRPLFTVRFLLDMEDISKFYIDQMVKDFKDKNIEVENRISNYFWDKIQNITSSGMSNKGFGPLLSVTKKMDVMRKKTRENVIENLKGRNRRKV